MLRKCFVMVISILMVLVFFGSCGGSGSDPALTGSIVIDSFIAVGQTITADTKGIGGEGNLSFQWQFGDEAAGDFSNIPDAKDDEYDVVSVDFGKFIRVRISRQGHSGYVFSNAVRVRREGAVRPEVDLVVINNNHSTLSRGAAFNISGYASFGVGNLINSDSVVTWSISSTVASGTFIDNKFGNGWLFVAQNETAANITIRATSTFDTSKFNEITIPVADFTGTTITITNMDARTGFTDIVFYDKDWYYVSSALGFIQNGQVLLHLQSLDFINYVYVPSDVSGEHNVVLHFYEADGGVSDYIYTANNNITDVKSGVRLYNITGSNSIALSQFRMYARPELIVTGFSGLNGREVFVDVLVSQYNWAGFGEGTIANNSLRVTLGGISLLVLDVPFLLRLNLWSDGMWNEEDIIYQLSGFTLTGNSTTLALSDFTMIGL